MLATVSRKRMLGSQALNIASTLKGVGRTLIGIFRVGISPPISSPLQALHKLSDRGVMEWAAFAATLAQRLARMLAAGLISPAHQIWNLAVDKILIQSVDADIQVCLS